MIKIFIVKSRDFIHVCPHFLILLVPSRNSVSLRLTQVDRGIELKEMRRKGMYQDSIDSSHRPVIHRDLVWHIGTPEHDNVERHSYMCYGLRCICSVTVFGAFTCASDLGYLSE